MNGACLALKTCALNRDDQKEQTLAGRSIKELEEDDYPVCTSERATFMADFSFPVTLSHPYAQSSPGTHGRLKDTVVQFPAFSAAAVPYNWMLKKSAGEKAGFYALDFDEAREPRLDWEGKDIWVQEFGNQKSLLNCFFEHLKEETSLVFFYAKQVPFTEETRRILVAVGRINKIIASAAYEGSDSRFGAAYWEHMIMHSIRQNQSDGFILPYHAGLEYQQTHPDFDMAEMTVVVPDDKRFEFSYAAEHVGSDSAIRVLLECVNAIEAAEKYHIGTGHRQMIQWIHDEVATLEKLRGAHPGMGSALCAFGIEKGHFVAAEIINKLEDELQNPWVLWEKALTDPEGILSPVIANLIPENGKKIYQLLKGKSDSSRLDFLHLLSRFDLSIDQAKILFVEEERQANGIAVSEKGFLENPYLIYEALRLSLIPVAMETIDLGLYLKHQPEVYPQGLIYDDPLNSFRIRALTTAQLELAAIAGHTLLPRRQLIEQIRKLSIQPPCPLNSDYYELAETCFEQAIIVAEMKNGDTAYQLERLSRARQIIIQNVTERVSGKELTLSADWPALLHKALKEFTVGEPDETEVEARKEKSAALKTIAESRFSVLIGPAGTGKTTLLTILAGQPDAENNGVLLLAPTGKARVRMEEVSRDLKVTAKTLAQFLSGYDRYNGDTQRYLFSNKYCNGLYETVIMDEASMLTEEMLATVLDCLKGVKRLILVGDHRQLPPIGPGRPFIDIIHYLQPEGIETAFPRVQQNYAELTIKMRQGGAKREDLQLAEWFSGESLEPGADAIINQILTQPNSTYLRMENWENEFDFDRLLEKVLVQELGMSSLDDIEQFNKSLGSNDGRYFNFREAAKKVESWQILSPLREKPFGIKAINRKIHKLFRQDKINYARSRKGKIPAPIGLEEIVYGDKVINLANSKRKPGDVWPQEKSLNYIANGEIGVVVGQFKLPSHTYPGRPKYTEVEFTSQKGYKYIFKSGEFSEEGNTPLELAYALTVHKSQGSEFKKVFLVIPNPCLLLTREMLYTALTRQKEKVILLYQGQTFDIKELASPLKSDAFKRITNLFVLPDLVEVDGYYLEKNLIHQASDGQMLRSKSEQLIYQRLIDKDLPALYEKKLVLKEVEKLPDFTIDHQESGVVYYWEHCGMLYDSRYKARWDEKYQWYRDNEILPFEEGGGRLGTLIVTVDKPFVVEDGSIRGAISIMEIDELLKTIFKR